MVGEIGEAEKRGKTRQEISKIDAQTAVLETQRKSEKAQADAELTTTQTKLDMNIRLAQIEASRNAESRDAQLQRDVEIQRADMELERQRAADLVHAKIAREVAEQRTNAAAYNETKTAEATLYARKQDAEAAAFRTTTEAEAAFFAKRKEAEGIAEMAKAYGEMAAVLGGPAGLLQYLYMQSGTFEKLANANAHAVQGLQPKISIWNTDGAAAADAGAPIRNLFQNLPPLLQTVQEQTGITPPTWLAQMPKQQIGQQGGQQVGNAKGSKGMVNGN